MMRSQVTINTTTQTIVVVVFAIMVSTLGASVVASAVLPEAVDWHVALYPATRALMDGHNPYGVYDVHNPPWVFVALAPFAADVEAGRGALFVTSLVVYALVAYAIGAKPVALGLWLMCPPLLHTLLHGNLEWLVLAGLVMPPRWGLFFVLIKPQVAGAVALWWTVEAWRDGGWRAVVALLWPVTVAGIASVVVFGAWFASAADMPAQWWNASLWPYSIPFGLAFVGWSLYVRDWRYALAASPMLSPYVLLHAWAGAVLATVHKTWLLALVVAVLWALVLRQAI